MPLCNFLCNLVDKMQRPENSIRPCRQLSFDKELLVYTSNTRLCYLNINFWLRGPERQVLELVSLVCDSACDFETVSTWMPTHGF